MQTILRLDGKTAHDDVRQLVRHLHQFADGRQTIRLDPALQTVDGCFPGQHLVDGGTHRINVGKGTLLRGGGILLLRRIAGLENNGQALFVIAGRNSCRAEIQNFNLAVVADENIVGGDVPMDQPGSMNFPQCLQDGEHDLHGLRNAVGAFFRQNIFDVFAFQKLHDDIRRVVGLQTVIDLDNAFQIVEPCQTPAFVQHPADAVLKQTLRLFVVAGDVQLPRDAGGKTGGHELLDGDLFVQAGVPRNVGDPKTALPEAAPDQIPIDQDRARLQMVSGLRRRAFDVAAVGAYVIYFIVLIHTA